MGQSCQDGLCAIAHAAKGTRLLGPERPRLCLSERRSLGAQMPDKRTNMTSLTEPPSKSFIMEMVFLAQRLGLERKLSALEKPREAFIRVRDVMFSEHLSAVYYPIPKAGCTAIATLLATYDPECSDFDPVEDGVHRYRFRKAALRPDSLEPLYSARNWRFTVIRSPAERIVSGYIDKFVKPFFQYPHLDSSLAAGWTLRKVVEKLARLRDSQINKHWRPQYRFFNYAELDYIGAFERMDLVFEIVYSVLGVAPGEASRNRVYKKTEYSNEGDPLPKSPADMTPIEFRDVGRVPPASDFLTDDVAKVIKERYRWDYELHAEALSQSGDDSKIK